MQSGSATLERRRKLAAWFALVFWFASLLSSSAADWEQGKGFRSRALTLPSSGKTGFTLLPPSATGINFTNQLSLPRQLRSSVLMSGAGVAAGDVDGDGLCDLYFCGLDGPNVLYRNLGNWKFQDITAEAGVAMPNIDPTGAAFADMDGDGDLDLLVNTTGAGTHVFINDGKGHFQLAGTLNPGRGGTSLALADVDGDSFLDLYVANYRTSMLVDMPQTYFRFKEVNGKKVVISVNGRSVTEPDLVDRFTVNEKGGVDEQGEADVLFRNLGGTNIVPVSFTDGTFLDEDGKPLKSAPLDWGLSVMMRDFNGDGLPDIFVCNDFDSPDRLWLNKGGGRFQAAPRLALRKISLFCMGVDVADINRDGYDDFFTLDMLSRDHVHRLTQMPDRKAAMSLVGKFENRPQYTMNMLFLGHADGTFSEVGQLAGVAASEWSWTPVFLDVDLDGWEDLLVANGHARDARNLDTLERLKAMRTGKQVSNDEILESRKIFPSLAVPKLAFRNRHDLTFEEVGKQWGFDTLAVSHGMALADLDNDGDLDVVVNNLNGPAGIYRNDTVAPRIAIRLSGEGGNSKGIGARIKVMGGPVTQTQEIICGGRYLASDEPVRTFAAGNVTNELSIEVQWRSGKTSLVTGAHANRLYEIQESGAELRSQKSTTERPGAPAFEDVSSRLRHVHGDEPFDDFERQPLLIKKLSQNGPGISWVDLDGDGWDDLIIGSGKGGQMGVFQNDGHGSFKPWNSTALAFPIMRDQTTVLAWQKAPGQVVLLAGSANYEDGLASGACARTFDLKQGTVQEDLPPRQSSTGPMALGDLDGDGNLDLFVGGRVIPGKYPEPASSALFRGRDGKFELDEANTKLLAGIGMVSGAVFSDLDGDGAPELVLACEWGPVKVFRNEKGKLLDITAKLGLNKFIGWWNGVNTGDFDGDGRMDIVASNWGRNTPYESHRDAGLSLVYGDLDGDGTEDLLEAYYDPVYRKLVPERMVSFVARALPFVRARYETYESFARASVEEICGEAWKNAKQLQANWLESTLFLNRGDHFEAHPLPMEAQMAPGFAVCVGDLDGDGNEDVFLSQNFFATQPDIPRYDAGRGLLLRGNGRGGFTAVSGEQAGIKLYAEQRGAALCDFDGDGRVDLAVGQNGAETKLYRNVAAKPGLRVRLAGPARNPNGVGAILRLGNGPAREIHAGSGYWSQDSTMQVLA